MRSPAFQPRPTLRQVFLCRFFVSAAVRYPQFRSSPDGVARVASLRLLEERIISGTRQLRANRFVKLMPTRSSSPGVGLKNCGSQHVLRPVSMHLPKVAYVLGAAALVLARAV
jgi:hypothetical protein